jgi:hypothetical protein
VSGHLSLLPLILLVSLFLLPLLVASLSPWFLLPVTWLAQHFPTAGTSAVAQSRWLLHVAPMLMVLMLGSCGLVLSMLSRVRQWSVEWRIRSSGTDVFHGLSFMFSSHRKTDSGGGVPIYGSWWWCEVLFEVSLITLSYSKVNGCQQRSGVGLSELSGLTGFASLG